MRSIVHNSLWGISLPACLLACLALAASAVADGQGVKLEVHEWGVWLTEPAKDVLNERQAYPDAIPGVANYRRGKVVRPGPEQIAPLCALTFYGDPRPDVVVHLQAKEGRFLAHWPILGFGSNELRWTALALLRPDVTSEKLLEMPDGHWFRDARKLPGALYLRRLSRVDRLIAYDLELKMPAPIVVEGGPDRFRLTNLTAFPIFDVVLSAPGGDGRRIAWIDRLAPGAASTAPEHPADQTSADRTDAAKAVEVTLSDPLDGKSPEFHRQTTADLKARLVNAGLTDAEVDLLISMYGKAIFESAGMVLAARFAPEALDARVPLRILPEPSKTVRVVLVLIRNVSPQLDAELKALIADLGHPDYNRRERAEKRLLEIGDAATTSVKAALGSDDAEVVFRAERILQTLGKSLDSNSKENRAFPIFAPLGR